MIGDLGENLLMVFLSRKTAQGHLFSPTLIGDKWPTIDLYAEVIGNYNSKMFCFFQVKTTDQGYTVQDKKLKIQVKLQDLVRLSKYNAPTYLIGIDHNETEPFKSKGYIATIRGPQTNRLSSLPTTYELTEANLVLLRDEVVSYWNSVNTMVRKPIYPSNFDI